ncbi:MAG: envelope stress response membrane protein PspC [Xanthomonadales bacterium]|nr:envelope stress response membrane protein PspC [Xanthomonadales bacterium]NIX11767.1 envelope stress response membrane protein PspC [Xanthomonadales bacterium]
MSDQYQRRNPHRLYRDRENAIIAGVCAGLAEYFGFNRRAVRIIVGVGAIFFLPFVFVSYVLLAIVLPVKPAEPRIEEEEAKFWRGVSNAPSDVFSGVKHRFRELDLRLQKMEAFVTSKEFEIDRELGRNGLGGGPDGK